MVGLSLGRFSLRVFGCRLTLGLVCLLASFAGLRAQSDSWDATIAEGDRALVGRDLARAEELFQIALTQAPASDWRRPTSLVRLARVYQAGGDFAKPETLYRQADQLAKDSFEDPDYADFLNEVGRYYHTRRKYEIAEGFYVQGFSGRVKAHGQEHVKVADSINNLAVLYENQGRFPKAEVYYQHALSIRGKVLGAENVKTIETCEHFSRLLHKLTRGDEAAPLEERARAFRQPLLQAAVGATVEVPDVAVSGPAVKAPELIDQPDPEYTDEAKIARQEGSVAIHVEIDTEGVPRNLRVVRTLGLGLDEKAIEAVKRWRFRPARSNGRKVAFRATLEINFRLL